MNSSRIEPAVARAKDVKLTADALIVELTDGRTITAPIAWYPRLQHGTKAERRNWRPIGDGEGIHWPDLDEDIEVEALVLGARSAESQRSFERWLSTRKPRSTG